MLFRSAASSLSPFPYPQTTVPINTLLTNGLIQVSAYRPRALLNGQTYRIANRIFDSEQSYAALDESKGSNASLQVLAIGVEARGYDKS